MLIHAFTKLMMGMSGPFTVHEAIDDSPMAPYVPITSPPSPLSYSSTVSSVDVQTMFLGCGRRVHFQLEMLEHVRRRVQNVLDLNHLDLKTLARLMEVYFDTEALCLAYDRLPRVPGHHHRQFRFALTKNIHKILGLVSAISFLTGWTMGEPFLVQFRNHILDTTHLIRTYLAPCRAVRYNEYAECFYTLVQIQQDMERVRRGETRTLFLRRSIPDRLMSTIGQWKKWML